MSDLQTLFSQDPLTYTKEGQELEKIIIAFRAARKQFLAGNIKAGSTKPKSAKEVQVTGLMEKLGNDLDLSL